MGAEWLNGANSKTIGPSQGGSWVRTHSLRLAGARDGFAGEVIHSSAYRNPEPMRHNRAQEDSIARDVDDRSVRREERIEREINWDRDLGPGFGIE